MSKPMKMSAIQAADGLKKLSGWSLNAAGELEKLFGFKDYHQTIAFVNAVAAIANEMNHHPDLSVHYSKCIVRFSTHDVGGLSDLDFEAARRVDSAK